MTEATVSAAACPNVRFKYLCHLKGASSCYVASLCPPQDSWEIVEGLRGLPASMQEPDKQEGFVLKRRKWPMKGWHKVSTSLVILNLPTLTAIRLLSSLWISLV